MGKIVLICDTEEGHIFPTFALAQCLLQRGHEIIYAGIADNERMVTAQGFTFYPLLEDVFPKGFRQTFQHRDQLPAGEDQPAQTRVNRANIEDRLNTMRHNHIKQLVHGAYDSFINDTRADLYLVNTYLPFAMLILYYKYRIRPVILSPCLRDPGQRMSKYCLKFITGLSGAERSLIMQFLCNVGINFSSLQEVIAPLDSFYDIILCPFELETGKEAPEPSTYYVEASIRRVSLPVNVYDTWNIPRGKKIIYASLGSQAIRHGITCDAFYNKVINAMKFPALQYFHLILCVDRVYDTSRLHSIPGHVTILNWAPQIDILQAASLAIIHGGIGSVKECIYYGVPMIVFPLGFDQPFNAQRVAHHQLGITGDIKTISAHELATLIGQVLHDAGILLALRNMQAIFTEKEKEQAGVKVIEELMQCNTTVAAQKLPATHPSGIAGYSR